MSTGNIMINEAGKLIEIKHSQAAVVVADLAPVAAAAPPAGTRKRQKESSGKNKITRRM
jgi:hypothetical protein